MTNVALNLRRGLLGASGGRYAFKDNQINYEVTPGWAHGGYNVPNHVSFGTVTKSQVYMKVSQSVSDNPTSIFTSGNKLRDNYQNTEMWPNIVYTANILLNNGFSLNATAAILANITSESGFNPGCYAWPNGLNDDLDGYEESLTFGLFQWYHYHDITNYIPYPKNSPYYMGEGATFAGTRTDEHIGDAVKSEWEFSCNKKKYSENQCDGSHCKIKVLKPEYDTTDKALPVLGGKYKNSEEMKQYYRSAALWPEWDLYDIEVQLGMFCCFDVETSYMKYDFSNRKNWKGSKSIYNGWQDNLRDYYWVHGVQQHLPVISVEEFKTSSESAGYLAIQFMASYLRPAGGAENDKGGRYDRGQIFYDILSNAEVTFEPRFTAPVVDKSKNPLDYFFYSTKDYLKTADCPYYPSGNCVAYAKCRAQEILSKHSNLDGKLVDIGNGSKIKFVEITDRTSTGMFLARNGGLNYGINKELYDSGKGGFPYSDANGIPRVGSIMCWEYTDGGAGHVAVVEEVIDNGHVKISESASGGFYDGDIFKVWDRYAKEKWTWKSKAKFQGFVYLPVGTSSIAPSSSEKDKNDGVLLGWRKDEKTGKYSLSYPGKVNAKTLGMHVPAPSKVGNVVVTADVEVVKLSTDKDAKKDAHLYLYVCPELASSNSKASGMPKDGKIDKEALNAGYPKGLAYSHIIDLGKSDSIIGGKPGAVRTVVFNIPMRNSRHFNNLFKDSKTKLPADVGYWAITTTTDKGNYIINVNIKEVKFC